MGKLNGKVALITGASRGIGAAAAREFVAEGAKVALLARSGDEIAELAGELGADSAIAIPCDISRFWEMRAAVDACIQTFGALDILVNNAGVIEPISHLSDADPDAWGQVIDINLKGVFNGMRAAMPAMIEAGSGTILTISSGAAHNPIEAWSHYCASKAGAAMLTRCADHEARDKGLRIMGLSPGTVATEMQREIKASGVNPVSKLEWDDHIPPEWPAKALVWMCGAESDAHLGGEISLRDEDIRNTIGLRR
ncbi:SDR family oxidoreductase [Palleronia sp. LCG004]|uniref:SDR family oxidoreductase n=1 Tax=Palleronia sp. LCG004 TaxID=3079304 RepID=UPI0029421E6D|nr:SDR family oxidoreductase [Palleronia sp. LCG004]WOI56315.1 SDR family oxidoreductase [Palleronia sp. LCG004]